MGFDYEIKNAGIRGFLKEFGGIGACGIFILREQNCSSGGKNSEPSLTPGILFCEFIFQIFDGRKAALQFPGEPWDIHYRLGQRAVSLSHNLWDNCRIFRVR
jgi:hypothetical protein